MMNDLNDEIFDSVLQRAFCDYDDEQLASYSDCETLAKMYPLPKKEKRAFDRAVKEIKYGKSLVRVYLSRAAVIFLCIIALGTGIMIASPTVRAAVRNVIVEWFDKYTHFSFIATDADMGDFENIEDVKIGYVPDGFELEYTDKFPGDITYIYSLSEDRDNLFLIEVFENEWTDLFPDNERSEYTITKINGHEAWIIYDEKNISGSVILVGAKISVLISGDLPKNELIKTAESIK